MHANALVKLDLYYRGPLVIRLSFDGVPYDGAFT